MKISDNQNFVEVDGVKGEFVELKKNQKRPCRSCVWYSGESVHCEVIFPCGSWIRKDKKSGYFKEVK